MNFKFFLLTTLLFNFGCGVKSNPLPPVDTALPSYIQHHLKTDEVAKKASNKKEEEKKSEQKKKK